MHVNVLQTQTDSVQILLKLGPSEVSRQGSTWRSTAVSPRASRPYNYNKAKSAPFFSRASLEIVLDRKEEKKRLSTSRDGHLPCYC